jgi:hypothetical protein
MNNIILKAKIVLSQLFDIPIYNFEDNISRKREVVEARRFLVFYLRDIFKLEYTKIVKHIPALTNHAKLTESSDLDIEKTMLELILERKNLNKKINELRKIL